MAGSALSSFAVVWVLFYQLTLLSGAFGFLICWYACFLAVFWVVTNQVVDRSAATDRVVTTVVGTCAAVVVGALLYIVIWVVLKGVAHFSFGFLFRTMKDYQPASGTDSSARSASARRSWERSRRSGLRLSWRSPSPSSPPSS